ncbi:MAG: hypothetical protein ACOC2V_01700 [Alkalispirochaeta sp.]
MADYNARIKEIRAVRNAGRSEYDRLRRLAGEHYIPLIGSEDLEAKDPPAAALLNRYREIREKMEHSSSALERMIRIDERQTEIRSHMRELQKELEQKESGRGLEGTYEAVGAAAFRLFREHPLVDATYSAAFSGVARYQDEIHRLDTQLQQLQSDPTAESASVFRKISRRGRELVLKNRRAVKENQLPGLLQKLGRDLASTDFLDAMDDPELTAAAEPIRAVEERKEQLRREIEALSTESRTLVEEFNALSGGSRLQRAQQHREDEIAAYREKLNEILLELGSLAEERSPQELTEDLERVQTEKERLAHFDEILHRLEAGKRAKSLQGEIAENEQRRNDLDARIADLEQKKRNLAEEAVAMSKEVEDLIKRRGDERDLFDS